MGSWVLCWLIVVLVTCCVGYLLCCLFVVLVCWLFVVLVGCWVGWLVGWLVQCTNSTWLTNISLWIKALSQLIAGNSCSRVRTQQKLQQLHCNSKCLKRLARLHGRGALLYQGHLQATAVNNRARQYCTQHPRNHTPNNKVPTWCPRAPILGGALTVPSDTSFHTSSHALSLVMSAKSLGESPAS